MNLHRSRASRWRLHGLSPVVVEAAEAVQLKGSFSLLRAPEIRQAPLVWKRGGGASLLYKERCQICLCFRFWDPEKDADTNVDKSISNPRIVEVFQCFLVESGGNFQCSSSTKGWHMMRHAAIVIFQGNIAIVS